MQLFDVASRHMEWLGHRQSVTAANIANADTPGYQTRSLSAFEDSLLQAGIELTQTAPAHMALNEQSHQTVRALQQDGWDRSLSGNDVALERELMVAGESSRMMALDTSLTRSFHRMILSSLKV